MKITYRHKATQNTVDLDTLKANRGDKVIIGDTETVFCTYNVDEVPFSNDWEVVPVVYNQFTKDELRMMIYLLQGCEAVLSDDVAALELFKRVSGVFNNV